MIGSSLGSGAVLPRDSEMWYNVNNMAKSRGSYKKGETGNEKGRMPAERERAFYKFLDTVAIPAAILKLYNIVIDVDPEIIKATKCEKIRLQIDAAKALLNRAPQRLEGGGEGGEFIIKWETS